MMLVLSCRSSVNKPDYFLKIMKSILCYYFVLTIGVIVQGYHHDRKEFIRDPWKGIPMVCTTEDPNNTSISCHGVRIVKRVIQQLLESAANVPSIELTEGISLVESRDDAKKKARNMKNSILEFLEARELRIKLPSLLPSNFEAVIRDSLPKGRGSSSNGLGFGGGGGKKGDNSFMILALMMGKMLGAMGFGALALLAMKALMVSSLALMLSLIVAAKKFASSGHSEGGHHVVYAQEVTGQHHVKRSTDDPELSPYRGYATSFGDPKSI